MDVNEITNASKSNSQELLAFTNPIEKVDYIAIGVQYALLSKAIQKIGIDISGLPAGASLTLDRCGDVYLTVGGGPGVATSISSSKKVGTSGVIGSYDGAVSSDNNTAQDQMINLLEGYGEESQTAVAYLGMGKLKSSGGTATEYFVGSPSLGSNTVAGYGILLYKNPNPTNNIFDAVKSLGSITVDEIIQQHPELKDTVDNINQGIQNIKDKASSILNYNIGLNKNDNANLYSNATLDKSQNAHLVDSAKIDEIKKTAKPCNDLPRNPHSRDLFNAYAKDTLEKSGQDWTADNNKMIAEAMLKDGVRPQRVEEALKHSPELVDNAYYFVKGIRNSSVMEQVEQSRGMKIG